MMWVWKIWMPQVGYRKLRRPDVAGPPSGRSRAPGPDFSIFARLNEILPRCRKCCPESENCAPVMKFAPLDVVLLSPMKLKRSGPILHGLRPRSPMRRLSLTEACFGPQMISRAQRCEQRFLPVLSLAPWLNKLRGRAVRLVGLLPVVRNRA